MGNKLKMQGVEQHMRQIDGAPRPPWRHPEPYSTINADKTKQQAQRKARKASRQAGK